MSISHVTCGTYASHGTCHCEGREWGHVSRAERHGTIYLDSCRESWQICPASFFQKSPVFVWLFLQKNPRNRGCLQIVATSIRLIRIVTTGPWQLVWLGSSIDCGQTSCVCVCVCVCVGLTFSYVFSGTLHQRACVCVCMCVCWPDGCRSAVWSCTSSSWSADILPRRLGGKLGNSSITWTRS